MLMTPAEFGKFTEDKTERRGNPGGQNQVQMILSQCGN
jgi:hypothetical protein